MTPVASSDTHQGWLRRVSDFHSGGIADDERARVEAHLATCATCQEALGAYQRFYALARSPLALGAPSADLAGRRSLSERRLLLRWPTRSAATPDSDADERTMRQNRTRAGLAAGLVAALLIASFVALLAPHLGGPGVTTAPTPTLTSPPNPTSTVAPEPTVTETATPVPFVCANAPGSQSMYAFLDHDRQIYRVTGCANPVRLTNYDEKSYARPLAFSPTNRWLMVSVDQNISETSYPECQVLINPVNGAAVATPFCSDGGNDTWTEWPAFIAWLDDNTFLESVTHKDNTVSVVRVNATTFARSPVATMTYVANFGSVASPVGIKFAGGALYYGGYASQSEGGGWLHRVSLATGADTRIVRLGAASNGGCQVGTNPCTWTGPWDVSPDGGHILYYNPGPTVAPSDTCQDEPETPLFYARSDGSSPVRLFADQPLGRTFPAPLFSPDGKRVAWMVNVGPICTAARHGVIQSVSGGVVTALPASYGVASWRNDGTAAVVMTPTGGAALYTLATGTLTRLPTQDGMADSYVWGT
jgi:Putative zinc-finger